MICKKSDKNFFFNISNSWLGWIHRQREKRQIILSLKRNVRISRKQECLIWLSIIERQIMQRELPISHQVESFDKLYHT